MRTHARILTAECPLLFNFSDSAFLAFLIVVLASFLAKIFVLLISSSLGSRSILPMTMSLHFPLSFPPHLCRFFLQKGKQQQLNSIKAHYLYPVIFRSDLSA
jgi:hypothetical protein